MKPDQRVAAGLAMARKAGADLPEQIKESRTLFIDGLEAFNSQGKLIAVLESAQHGFEIAAMRGFTEVVDVNSKARYVEASIQTRSKDLTSALDKINSLQKRYKEIPEKVLIPILADVWQAGYEAKDDDYYGETLQESQQDQMKAAVRDYFKARMPEEVQQAWANASANLMYGPSAGEGSFQSNTEIVKQWADQNIFDVYYDDQSGEVMENEPQGFEERGEWIEPDPYWQIDGYDAKRWIFGELARYV